MGKAKRSVSAQCRTARPTVHILICAALALSSVAVYMRTARYAFIGIDDGAYVSQNPMVNHGFSLRGILWAFTTLHSANWHPLTWLSHMLDCQMYGLNPGMHHLTNVNDAIEQFRAALKIKPD